MADSFEILFETLEINKKQGLFRFSNINKWEQYFPYRIIRALKIVKPYAIYAIHNNNEQDSYFTPIYLFIDNTNKIDIHSLNLKLWNLQIPIIAIDDGNQWYLFSGEFLN